MKGAALVALLASACASPLPADFDGPPYLTLQGAVELSGPAGEDPVFAAVAWAWTQDGTMHSVVHEVPFEPEVYFYRLTVPGPPAEEATRDGPAPADLGDEAVLIGLPLLLQATGVPTADPEGFARWLSGERVPPDEWLDVPGGRVLAWADDHLLLGMATGGAARLGESPGVDLGTLCGVEDVLAGLTLYQRAGEPQCPDSWEALAPPGARTDFQGVTMRSP